jgi:outer membrane protein TolC
MSPVPAQIDGFDKIIESFKIPGTAEEALSIGLEKSPELQQTNYSLEGAKLNHQAHKASQLPSVSLGVSKKLGQIKFRRSD